MPIKPEYQTKIIAILTALFPEANIYLFGSQARNTAVQGSDIDIALDAGVRIDRSRLGEARSVLGELHIPYNVDLVDMYAVSETMRQHIMQDKIVWKS
jgi:predicted nucleotidyltransferase